MAKLSSIQLDPVKVNEGVWEVYALDIEVKIAQMGNKEYDAEIRRLSRPYTRGFRTDSMPDSVLEEITMKAIARILIKGWRGMDDDNGNPIPFSPEKALEIIKDPQYRDFYKWIQSIANNEKKYRRDVLDESVKN